MTDVRGVLALMANPGARRAVARLEIGASLAEAVAGLSPSKRAHLLRTLERVGVVDSSGAYQPEVYADALRALPRAERPTGIRRFLNGDGTIDRYPTSEAERRELLKLVADDVLTDDEVVSERELGERLARWTDDVALLRRWLIDESILERTRNGSEYARVDQSSVTSN